MERDQLSRKLAVILHADVVGSTRLVQNNEALAHHRIQITFVKFAETIKSYGGIARELRGDALVAEFKRASDAVTAALAFQDMNTGINAQYADDIQPVLRIGISMGEVIIADNTMTGAGIVLAQRLEQLANSGEVVVQGSVSETVPVWLPLDFHYMGERAVKGFEQPVRAFSVKLRSGNTLPHPDEIARSKDSEPDDIEGYAVPNREIFEALTGERLRLPNKPSIAVLPFHNISGDTEQEHIADGMTEDIITVLARVPDLIVIARNSAFVYKGQAIDMRQVGYDLGVGYVLEGSIHKIGDQLRISTQLSDSHSGDQIWAERYDREINDIFAVQDEITRKIVIALSVNLTYGDDSRIWQERSSNFQVWDLLQRGLMEHLKFTREGNREAMQIVRRACDLDPEYYISKLLLGWILVIAARYGFASNPEAATTEAESLAREALGQEKNNGGAYTLLCFILTVRFKSEEGIAYGKQAIELEPGGATNHAALAVALFYNGDYEASLVRMKKAIRLSPYAPDWFLGYLGDAYRGLGDLEKAREVYEHLAIRMPDSQLSQTRLACIYSDIGEMDRAREAADNLLSINPAFSVNKFMQMKPFRQNKDRENLAAALLKSGLPG